MLQLEPQYIGNLNFCKLHFLREQNKWMVRELQYLDDLIAKMKSTIKIGISNEQNSLDKVTESTQRINSSIKQHMKQQQVYIHSTNFIQILQPQLNESQSSNILQTLVSSIDDYNRKIQHVREQFNRLENKQVNIDYDEKIWKRINCIDVSSQIISYYYQLIKQLKKSIVRLENSNGPIKNRNDSQYDYKTNQTQRSTQSESLECFDQVMNTFEKTVAIFQQKLFNNKKKKQKINWLKQEIQRKKYYIKKITQANKQESIWNFSFKSPQNKGHMLNSEADQFSNNEDNMNHNINPDFDLQLSLIEVTMDHRLSSQLP